ncbi:unnamed protein product [Mytilus coruscus]|uniref:DUF4605 domain-containing protein n=1 Tax=Mytilus coruscus TaxID=42192 RepID=A0A6J8CBX9_MYTCO|nr:unnamed protein product [Mytilus coruscus]
MRYEFNSSLMIKIKALNYLHNGDIVPDDDPRAQQSSSRSGRPTSARPRQGFVQHDNNAYQQGQAGGQSVSVFTVVNQKLLGYGLPRFNVGPYVVEPIVIVAFVLAGLLMGLPGLIFAALLFFVSQWSGIGGEGGGGGAGQRMGGGNQGGGGQRLG